MRPSSRRRAAAWLLALPAGRGGERCARRGRLEMISFWLLCWKLLRATAGLRRNIGELTDGDQEDSNQERSNQEDSNQDCSNQEDSNQDCSNQEDSNQDRSNQEDSNQDCSNQEDSNQDCSNQEDSNQDRSNQEDSNQDRSNQEDSNQDRSNQEDSNQDRSNQEDSNQDRSNQEDSNQDRSNQEDSNQDCSNQEDNNQEDSNQDRSNQEDSNQDRSNQEDSNQDRSNQEDSNQDRSNQDRSNQEDSNQEDSNQEDSNQDRSNQEDSNQDRSNQEDNNQEDSNQDNSNQDRGNQDHGYASTSLPVTRSPPPTKSAEPVTMETRASSPPPPPGTGTHSLMGCCDPDKEELHFPEGIGAWEMMSDEKKGGREGEEVEKKEGEVHQVEGVDEEEEVERGGMEGGVEEKENGQRGEENEEGGAEEGVQAEGAPSFEEVFTSDPPQLLLPAMMEQSQGQERGNYPNHGLPSDGLPNDGSHDDGHHNDGQLSDSPLSDCLQAELAMVTSSDSDIGEDQWESSAPRDITEQRVGVICSSEREEGEGEEEERRSTQREGGRMGDREMEGEEKKLTEAGAHGQKEEMEEQRRRAGDVLLCSPSVSSSASSTDTDRKESCSQNVFTGHLDFLLARQQWRKMEEEVKGKPLPQPSGRSQGSVQGTHSSLYPPTRSPHIQRRLVQQPPSRETPVSSTLSPSSEDSGLHDPWSRGPLEPESAVEREIRLTLEREERHRRERGRLSQGPSAARPVTLQTGRSPPRPPACRTPNLSISPTPLPRPISPASLPLSVSPSSLPRSVYHELTANNVIILEPDSAHSRSRLLSPGGFSDWSLASDALPSTDVIVVETANLIIRSASEFCLSSIPVATETQEASSTSSTSSTSSNPFFKLRSLSSQSLVEQEIRLVRQREEEWRRQREEEWRRRRGGGEWRGGKEKERFDTVLVSPGLNDNISFNVIEVPDRCVSSPSSPSRTRKMERSSMSCDHKFPPALSTLPRRQNAMAQRWEANLLANQKNE